MRGNRVERRSVAYLLGLIIGISLLVHVLSLILGRTVLRGWHFVHHPVHAAVEIAGAVIALGVARLLMSLHRRDEGTSFNITIAAALVGMGLLDGLHALFHAGNMFVWLHSSASFAGGVLFALVWLPRRWAPDQWPWWPWAVAAVVLPVGVTSIVQPDWTPVMVRDGVFTTAAELLNIVGGLLMFAAALRLVLTYRKTRNVDDLLFCLHCGLFGAAAVMFEQSSLWDFAWWGWHVLRLLAYGVAFWFLLRADERHLWQSLETTRAILESTIDAIITIDKRGGIVSANPAAERIFGYDAEELVGQNVRMLMPTPHHERHDEYLSEYLRTGNRNVIGNRRELTGRRQDGTRFPVELTVTEVDVDGGRMFTGMVRDLTETKRAQQDLYLMRAAIDSANESMYTISPDGRFLDVNSTACQRLGYSREELLSLSVWDINTRCSQEGWPELWEQVKTQQKMIVETQHCTKAGRVFPVEGSKFHVTFEGCEYICDFVRDISERQSAQQALTDSEERFRQLAAHLQDALWMTSADGKEIIYISPAYESIWGRSCASLYENPTSWSDGIHAEDRERVTKAFFERAAEAGFDETYRVVHPDGSVRWVHATGFPIRNEGGEIYRIAGVARDVTQQREYEHALSQAKAAAEEANIAKSQFLANMSHEIRTPLTGILGFADVLRRGIGSDEQKREHLDTIYGSGQHLLTLINDILDLSRIEAGQMEFERVSCSPDQIIVDVLSILRVRALEKSLRLECEWQSGVPEKIVTDPDRVRQALMNVVGNAIKFTETGSVQLVVSVDCESPDPRFQIEIHDTGIGIPADRLDRVFSPFDQLDASITRRYGGTGLGLAISRHIVRALGGDITVESEPGRGSVFRILLETGPLEGVRFFEVAQTEAFKQSNGERQNESQMLVDARILLVEDGETNRALVNLVLQEAGATVVCAEDGQQGLEAALNQQFDLVVMDMQMPVMDGYEATRQLRDQGYTTPIIALTAHAMRGDREKCLAAGCSGYLTKPIKLDNLLQTITDSLTTTGGQGESDAEFESLAVEMQTPSESSTPINSTLPTDRPEFRDIVEKFNTKLLDKLDEMEAAIAAEDLESLRELAHWLKGSGGTMGYACFTEPAQRLEQLAKQEQTDGLQDGLRELKNLAERITVAI